MPHKNMLAVCRHCGSVFDFEVLRPKNAKNITFRDCIVKCPFCPEYANILDGTFDFDADGNMTILSAPQLTYQVVNDLKDLIEKAKKEKYSKKQFIKEANSISPNLGNKLAKLAPKSFQDIMIFLTFVLALLQHCESKKTKSSSDINVVNTTTDTYVFNEDEIKKEVVQNKRKTPKAYKKKKRQIFRKN